MSKEHLKQMLKDYASGYYNITPSEDKPHYSDDAPTLFRNNPKYSWGAYYKHKPNMYWTPEKLDPFNMSNGPQPEERYHSDPNRPKTSLLDLVKNLIAGDK